MSTEPPFTSNLPGIGYSHYESRQRSGEQFIAEHGMCYVLAGTMRVVDAGQTHLFAAGSIFFYRKNFLAKFTKQPAADGPMRAIAVTFDRATLLEFSQQYGAGGELLPTVPSAAIVPLTSSSMLQSFFATLQPYFQMPLSVPLANLKRQEALLLLLQAHPELQAVLFDFGQPGKIDLEAFILQNFRFNVELKQLAYLTGRSLATFKRDFQKIFHTSPNRWLQHKRLEEAHYLLKEKNKRPSDVYHEVGFESLAHFSYSFKQFFGHNPSQIQPAAATR
jgi:AraC-like DNA-binding protein